MSIYRLEERRPRPAGPGDRPGRRRPAGYTIQLPDRADERHDHAPGPGDRRRRQPGPGPERPADPHDRHRAGRLHRRGQDHPGPLPPERQRHRLLGHPGRHHGRRARLPRRLVDRRTSRSSGDFDGDGMTDKALYRPSAGAFFIARTAAGGETVEPRRRTPRPGSLPVVGDFDGDGMTDFGLYNPATGLWTLAESTDGLQQVTFNTQASSPRSRATSPSPATTTATGVPSWPSTGRRPASSSSRPGTPAGGFDNIRVVDPRPDRTTRATCRCRATTTTRRRQHVTEAGRLQPDDRRLVHPGARAADPVQPRRHPRPGRLRRPRPDRAGRLPARINAFAIDGPSGSSRWARPATSRSPRRWSTATSSTAPPTLALLNATLAGRQRHDRPAPDLRRDDRPGADVDLLDANGDVVNSARWPTRNGHFAVGDPATLPNGTYSYTVRALSLVGGDRARRARP